MVSGASAFAACSLPDFGNPRLLVAMQRGVNLTGWDEADPARRPSRRQLEALRAEHFTHIRLPLDPARLTGKQARSYRAGIASQMAMLTDLGYAVSLDLHGGSEIGRLAGRNPERAFERLSKLWLSLVPLLRNSDPEKIALELLNEPEMEQDVWMAMAARLVTRLRAALPEHSFVIGPSGPQRHETLGGMQPLADRNIVYAIHYYDPFAFTHQGMTWGPPDDPLRFLGDLPFPARLSDPAVVRVMEDLQSQGRVSAAKELTQALEAPWDEAMMVEAFDVMAGWVRAHARPVIVNEFGVLTFTAPRDSRLHWLESVNRIARQRCIGWTHWDFQDGFGLIDPATRLPDAGVMRALAPG